MGGNLEEREKKAYVSLYKKDGLSYSLTLLAIVAELVYVISILDVMAVSFYMGFTVMLNIGILFALFTCAVKMNIYEKKLAYAALGVAVYMMVRQFILIPLVLKPYDRQMLIAAANITGACLLAAAGCISIYRSDRRRMLQEKLGKTEVEQRAR